MASWYGSAPPFARHMFRTNRPGNQTPYLPLVQAGGLYPNLVVQRRELIVPFHQLTEQHTLLAHNSIVLFDLVEGEG